MRNRLLLRAGVLGTVAATALVLAGAAAEAFASAPQPLQLISDRNRKTDIVPVRSARTR